jgi:type IV secretory pathway component VirB8
MSEQIKTHGHEIETIQRVDVLQDETDKKHDSLIAKNASKNIEQDKQIAAGVKKDVEQDSEIQRQQNVDKQHDEQLKKIKRLAWVGIGLAFCALIVAIIALIT